jgi:hypothetical protein
MIVITSRVFVAFIPKRSSLLAKGKIIFKGMSTGDGTLSNEARSVSPVRVLLKDSVPMLKFHPSEHYEWLVRQGELTILVLFSMVSFVKR